jgi:hypothetical protein
MRENLCRRCARRRARRGKPHQCDGTVWYPRVAVVCQCECNTPSADWVPPPISLGNYAPIKETR